MLRNYLKIAFRNLVRNKVYSFINIGGLAVGMAVAMLIGLWIYDETSFDKYNTNYEQIAQVRQNRNFNGIIETWQAVPFPVGNEIRNNFGNDFKYVVLATWTANHFLAFGDKKVIKMGNYMEKDAPELLSLKMLTGTRNAIEDPNSVLISRSNAKFLFGDVEPMGKIIKIDDKVNLKVSGVYEDLPYNSNFANLTFIMPWKQKLIESNWMETMENPWDMNSFLVYVQIAKNADMSKISAKIKNLKLGKINKNEINEKPAFFLDPISNWHLYGNFKDGKISGGNIELVTLFGIIGLFVLLLACINFVNLSTARSEKRAKEVGVRKAIGSARGQLIIQFFVESFLMIVISFFFSFLLIELILPLFNEISTKKIALLWQNVVFWEFILGFCVFTGLIAGIYPAFYLSSFKPITVLKGTFKIGQISNLPRKLLVILQFTVSTTMIIGTIIIFRQIQFVKNRPIGYNREGLISLKPLTQDIHNHFDAFRNELKGSGNILEVAESSGPLTDVWQTSGGLEWAGKLSNTVVDFPNTCVSQEYGKTVGWQFKKGRDFSKDFSTDSSAFVINEAAEKFMGLKNPLVETIKWNGKPYKIIGVIKDMIVESPFESVRPSIYNMEAFHNNFIVLRINPTRNKSKVLSNLETVFKKYSPSTPFEYKFVSEEYNQKFGDEERIGKLCSFFAMLAIFISCLGLFGLASFVAEQRTKEIGIRKILGATIMNLWTLLSKDFVLLVIISVLIATPIAYYFMNSWLQKYDYRTNISWWVFALSGLGVLLITLLTVSYQAIKAALMNPVKSLKSE